MYRSVHRADLHLCRTCACSIPGARLSRADGHQRARGAAVSTRASAARAGKADFAGHMKNLRLAHPKKARCGGAGESEMRAAREPVLGVAAAPSWAATQIFSFAGIWEIEPARARGTRSLRCRSSTCASPRSSPARSGTSAAPSLIPLGALGRALAGELATRSPDRRRVPRREPLGAGDRHPARGRALAMSPTACRPGRCAGAPKAHAGRRRPGVARSKMMGPRRAIPFSSSCPTTIR